MKNMLKSLVAIAALAFTTLSFTAIGPEKKAIKTASSSVEWKAYKVTGSHYGNINIKSGNLVFDGEALTGGEFVMDMTTIIATDLTGGSKNKLEKHLKSDDFFAVEKHSTAKLVFTNVKSTGKNSYEVAGDITIKGITDKVTLAVSVYGSKANATLKVDRTKFDIKYGSGSYFDDLKNKTIYDDFDIIADLEF